MAAVVSWGWRQWQQRSGKGGEGRQGAGGEEGDDGTYGGQLGGGLSGEQGSILQARRGGCAGWWRGTYAHAARGEEEAAAAAAGGGGDEASEANMAHAATHAAVRVGGQAQAR